jgi:maleylpyruvate isomerase
MPARTDNVTDPALSAALLIARRGQAYFSRKLHALSDEEFDRPSLLGGWDRRHLIAHVGLNARALTRLTHWAATGEETPMYDSPEQRDAEIALAATHHPQALRNLSDHAAVHLNVEWRDLTEDAWSHPVRTALGRTVPVSQTIWMRTREVWVHAVDLGNDGTFDDFPEELVDALLADITGTWERRGKAGEAIPSLVLEPHDRDTAYGVGDADTRKSIRGTAARLAAWAAGRPAPGVVTVDGSPPPHAPRWL